jgi:hypothetical protein
VNESKLIDELTAALDDVAAPLRVPPGAAQRARDRARRRRLTRALTATVPAAGLAAGLLVAVTVPHQPAGQPGGIASKPGTPQAKSGTSRATSGASAPALLTLGYVTSRERAALAAVPKLIVKTVSNGFVTWSYQPAEISRMKTFGRDGTLSSDELEWYTGGVIKPPAATGQTRHRIYVDYPTRTWWHLSQPAGIQKYLPVSGTLPVPQSNANGVVSILGHRSVDGKDTIEVKYAPPRGFKPTPGSYWATEYMYLDATSFLPVRSVINDGAPGDKAQATDFAYLPITTANLAIFKLTPPPAFQQVPPPPFHGDGQPGLGQIP